MTMKFLSPFVLGILACALFVGSFHCSGCTGGVMPRGSVWVVCR